MSFWSRFLDVGPSATLSRIIKSRMNRPTALILLLLLTLAVLAAAPFWGMEHVPLGTIWGGDDPVKNVIFWKIRIPRVFMAFLAGTALGTSGMAFQAMFRNPLATPFTLGVSSGASLGAALGMYYGWQFLFLGVSSTAVFALAGAAATILLVYGLTRAKRGFSTSTMLLAGVAINFSFSSLILFLQYQSNPTQTFRMLRWIMGGLESIVSYREILGVFPFAAAGCLIIFWLTHELNLLTTGEDLAASRGVEVDRVKRTVFFAASLMVGGVVAMCGPIGFVGLMAPHICRLLIGADHRWLAPATLLFGGAFLVLCDTVARTVLAPAELPVGIITSLLGGPFFLWLLLRGGEGELSG
jgi:iron complex transport system permease protein